MGLLVWCYSRKVGVQSGLNNKLDLFTDTKFYSHTFREERGWMGFDTCL